MLASLPASTSLHRLAGFLTGSLEARCVPTLDFILSYIALGIITVALTLQVLYSTLKMLDLSLKIYHLNL